MLDIKADVTKYTLLKVELNEDFILTMFISNYKKKLKYILSKNIILTKSRILTFAFAFQIILKIFKNFYRLFNKFKRIP